MPDPITDSGLSFGAFSNCRRHQRAMSGYPLRVICRHHPVSRERPLSAISGHGDGWGIDPLTRYEYDEWRVPLCEQPAHFTNQV